MNVKVTKNCVVKSGFVIGSTMARFCVINSVVEGLIETRHSDLQALYAAFVAYYLK